MTRTYRHPKVTSGAHAWTGGRKRGRERDGLSLYGKRDTTFSVQTLQRRFL